MSEATLLHSYDGMYYLTLNSQFLVMICLVLTSTNIWVMLNDVLLKNLSVLRINIELNWTDSLTKLIMCFVGSYFSSLLAALFSMDLTLKWSKPSALPLVVKGGSLWTLTQKSTFQNEFGGEMRATDKVAAKKNNFYLAI